MILPVEEVNKSEDGLSIRDVTNEIVTAKVQLDACVKDFMKQGQVLV